MFWLKKYRTVVAFQDEEIKEDTEVKTEEEEPKPKPRRKKKKQTGRCSHSALSFTLCMLGNFFFMLLLSSADFFQN